MANHELFDRSPMRLFDNISGGIKSGEFTLVTSKKGLGKTSIMVQFGVDTLFKSEELIHISFQKNESVINWYETIFAEIAKKKSISPETLHELLKKRVILNLAQDERVFSRVESTLSAIIQSGIAAKLVLVDDLDLTKIPPENLAAFKTFAQKSGFSVVVSFTSESGIITKELNAIFDSALHIEAIQNDVELTAVKLHGKTVDGVALKLDSKTLLITDKK
ncbi:MAG: AAA family ATPase [Treponemataceae bacterium]|nr:MAG: AAA family ATPase [Treponemataceae bacterium]